MSDPTLPNLMHSEMHPEGMPAMVPAAARSGFEDAPRAGILREAAAHHHALGLAEEVIKLPADHQIAYDAASLA